MERAPIALEPIGYVTTDVADQEVPRRRTELVSVIEIDDRYNSALDGIEDYSHLFVLFWMDQVKPGKFRNKGYPHGDRSLPRLGVLATRGRHHPNPIGLAVCELLRRSGSRLTVKRLDAFDGTPIIDIKPYDDYDVFTNIKVPSWWAARKRR